MLRVVLLNRDRSLFDEGGNVPANFQKLCEYFSIWATKGNFQLLFRNLLYFKKSNV